MILTNWTAPTTIDYHFQLSPSTGWWESSNGGNIGQVYSNRGFHGGTYQINIVSPRGSPFYTIATSKEKHWLFSIEHHKMTFNYWIITKRNTPSLKRWVLDGPAGEGAATLVSNFDWDSKPQEESAFEGPGVSASAADMFVPLTISAWPGRSLVQRQDFSARNPSFSFSISFEDEPYNTIIIKTY